MSNKILFVGLDNPQSADPRYALYPQPVGCAGHRLMMMMQEVDDRLSRAAYVQIPKTNLFPVGRWPTNNKKAWLLHAGRILVSQLTGTKTHVVLFGADARDAVFAINHRGPMHVIKPMEFNEIEGSYYAWVPHPSGRNMYYNDTRARRKVGRFLMSAHKLMSLLEETQGE